MSVQISSFEVALELEGAAAEGTLASAGPASAVFIRAPAILEVRNWHGENSASDMYIYIHTHIYTYTYIHRRDPTCKSWPRSKLPPVPMPVPASRRSTNSNKCKNKQKTMAARHA